MESVLQHVIKDSEQAAGFNNPSYHQSSMSHNCDHHVQVVNSAKYYILCYILIVWRLRVMYNTTNPLFRSTDIYPKHTSIFAEKLSNGFC